MRDHPVLFKITTLKKTLDGLRGLDGKLERVLRRKASKKGYDGFIGKRKERDEEENEKVAEDDESDAYGEEDENGDDDEEMEDEEDMGSEDNVVDTNELLTKTE